MGDIKQFMIVTGMSGAGKTTALYIVIVFVYLKVSKNSLSHKQFSVLFGVRIALEQLDGVPAHKLGLALVLDRGGDGLEGSLDRR